MKVRFTRQARQELLRQLEWLADRSPSAARDAAEQIAAKLALLGDFPLAAPAIDGRHRDAAVEFGRDGFVVRYRVDGGGVLIVGVFHGRQRRS